jgi:hypothetical protein
LPDNVYDFVAENIKTTSCVIRPFVSKFPILYAMSVLGCLQKEVSLENAVKIGNLHLTKYLHHRGNSWHAECTHAARYGHLNCLQYAHQNRCSLGDDSSCACKAALMHDHIDCFKYALEHGCPFEYAIDCSTFDGHRTAE